jgi:hypothetical protein
MIRPVTVSTRVNRPREEVYAHLDVLANHEAFTDHMLVDWTCSGPAQGVGAKARVRANVPGPADWLEIEVLEAEPPLRTVEETVGGRGRRRTRGTYTFEALPGGGTRVQFELRYLDAPVAERLAAPLIRLWLRRVNTKAMQRLVQQLERAPAPAAAGE